jgi:hypothetical protein
MSGRQRRRTSRSRQAMPETGIAGRRSTTDFLTRSERHHESRHESKAAVGLGTAASGPAQKSCKKFPRRLS